MFGNLAATGLGTPGEANSTARAINGSGQVAGHTYAASDVGRVILWGKVTKTSSAAGVDSRRA